MLIHAHLGPALMVAIAVWPLRIIILALAQVNIQDLTAIFVREII